MGVIATNLPPSISEFDVYYIEDLDVIQDIELRWVPVLNSDVVSYKVYRSIELTPNVEEIDQLELLATLGPDEFSYIHAIGTINDYYGISTVNSLGQESKISPLKNAEDYVPPLCRIIGRIVNLQGARVADAVVKAHVLQIPEYPGMERILITKQEVKTLTGIDGKFSLQVLQGAEILLEIDSIRVSDPIKVPNLPIVKYIDLPIFEEYMKFASSENF